MKMRYALFWAVTQRVMSIHYRRFGKTCRSRKVGNELSLHATLTARKSAYLEVRQVQSPKYKIIGSL